MGAFRLSRSPLRSVLSLILLAALAVLGNYLGLSVAFGVSFIFGSIFSIIAVARFGVIAGLCIAVLSSSYTFVLWNHPYAIIPFSLEILWVGIALKRGHTNIVLIDALYWLLLGTPQILLSYGGFMSMGLQSASIIILKQSMNGIFNALIAWILLSLLTMATGSDKTGFRSRLSYSQLVFQVATFFLMVPSLGILLIQAHRDVASHEEQLAQEISREANESANSLAQWISFHVIAARSIGELGTEYPLEPSEKLQEELERIHSLFPAFHTVLIGDASGTTIAFHPPVNERGEASIGINLADRAWFKEMKDSLCPTISDVFMGQLGVFAPMCTISVPIVREGHLFCFGLGAVNLDQLKSTMLEEASRESKIFTILDRKGDVVLSTDESKQPLAKEEDISTNQVVSRSSGVNLVIPGRTKQISTMESWRGAYYFMRLPIPGTPWTMQVEYPMAPLQEHLFRSAIWSLSVVALFFSAMIVLAAFISKLLAAPIFSLVRVSQNLPAKIENHERIDWPRSSFIELAELITNFRQASDTIDHSFSQLREYNVKLEDAVRERTAELATERQRLANILEGTNVGTWEWNVQTGEAIFNERWAEIIGYTIDELAPLSVDTWINFAHPDDLSASNELLEKHFRHELPYYECEARMCHKNGDWVWVLDRGKVATWTDDGKPLMMSGTHQDITARKQAEENQKTLVDNLARSNRDLQQFAYVASHDLQEPLRQVTSFAQLLTDRYGDQLDENAQEYLGFVVDGSKRMHSLIFDLLQYSRADSAGRTLEPVPLNDVLAQSVHNLSVAIEESQATITHDDLPIVHADKSQLVQVLQNLLSNAIKFRGEDPPIIHVGVERKGREWLFSVHDNGIGFPQEQADKIFQLFQRLHTRQHYEGTGLGLAICKRVIERQGGRMYAQSEPGKGATFYFTLPASGM